MGSYIVGKKSLPPIVILSWKDAHGSSTTAYSPHEIPHEAIIIDTIGVILRQDERGISIASEVCQDGTYRGVTFVPSELVINIFPVNPKRSPRNRNQSPNTKKHELINKNASQESL